MKILLDANLPHKLRFALAGHSVYTATHQGWATLKNGHLLASAQADGFEVLLTADSNMAYQQNMIGRPLGLVVLSTPSWFRIQAKITAITEAIEQCSPGSIVLVAL